MKSSIKKLKKCKNVIDLHLPPEAVSEEFNKVYEGIGKVAKVPGFRPGKVPRDLLEAHYAKTAKEEVIKNLIPESYRKILEQYKLDPIGYPDISDVKIDIKEGFSCTMFVETRPEFSLKNYKGLNLKKKDVEVKQTDVDKNLEYLREANAQFVPKKDSQDKEKVLPNLDDSFAKDLGFENLEKLKEAIKKNLELKAQEDAHADLEIQIINQLVESLDFEMPESLVNSEKERLLNDAKVRLQYIERLQKKENPDKKFQLDEKDKKELEENVELQALRQVKAFFILEEIAQIEKIYLKQEDVDKRIEAMAQQYKKTKEEIRDYLEKNHLLDELAVNMRNAKVMEFLLKEAVVA